MRSTSKPSIIRRLAALLLLLNAFMVEPAIAQQQPSGQLINPASQIAWPLITGSGAPAGANCSLTSQWGTPYTDITANVDYKCGSAGWFQIGSGGTVTLNGCQNPSVPGGTFNCNTQMSVGGTTIVGSKLLLQTAAGNPAMPASWTLNYQTPYTWALSFDDVSALVVPLQSGGDLGAQFNSAFALRPTGGIFYVPYSATPYAMSTNAVLTIPGNYTYTIMCDPGTVIQPTSAIAGQALAIQGSTTWTNASVKIEGCIFDGVNTAANTDGVAFIQHYGIEVDNSTIKNFTRGGLFFHGAGRATVINSQFTSNKYGIWERNCCGGAGPNISTDIHVIGGKIKSNSTWGIFEDYAGDAQLTGSFGNTYEGIDFVTNGTVSTATGNFFCDSCNNTVIASNTFAAPVGTVNLQLGNGTTSATLPTINNNHYDGTGNTGVDFADLTSVLGGFAYSNTIDSISTGFGFNAGGGTSKIAAFQNSNSGGTPSTYNSTAPSTFIYQVPGEVDSPIFGSRGYGIGVTLEPDSGATDSLLAYDPAGRLWLDTDSADNTTFLRGAQILNLLEIPSIAPGSGGPNCLNIANTGSLSTVGSAGNPCLTTGHQVSAALDCSDTSASGTAQSCTTSPSFTPVSGDCMFYNTTTANTGQGLTINWNALGAKSVLKMQGNTTLLIAGDIPANRRQVACYNGTNIVIYATGNTPAGTLLAAFTSTQQTANVASTAIASGQWINGTNTIPATGRYQVCMEGKITQAATTSSTMISLHALYTSAFDSVAGANINLSGAGSNSTGNTTTVASGQCAVLDILVGSTIQYNTTAYASTGATAMGYIFDIQVYTAN